MLERKRKHLIFGIVFVVLLCVGIIIYNMRLYMPELPVDQITRQQVYQKINDSQQQDSLIYLTHEDGYHWYVFEGNQKEGKLAFEKLLKSENINFVEQLGAGYIFEKNNKRIIIESQMWTGKYVIYQVPEEIRLDR